MSDLADLARQVVSRATDGEQLEAYVVRSRDVDVRAYDGHVEQLSSAESMGVGIRVVREQRQGFAYAGTFDEEAVADALGEARDNASFATVDPFAGLAAPDGVAPPATDLWRQDLLSVPTEKKVDLALELEAALRSADRRISGVQAADYGESIAEAAIATTTGIAAEARQTRCALSADVLATDGDETQTGFGFSVGRTIADLDIDAVTTDAVERATRMLGATKPPTERTTIVLDPLVTASVLGIVGATLSGEALMKGRTPFADRVGTDIAAPVVSLVDDPTDALAYTASHYDAEGLGARRNVLIEAGCLMRFVHNAWTARHFDTTSTGSAVRGGFKTMPSAGTRALALAPGTMGRDELIASVGDGVLVQAVSGLHSGVNPVSGDFSTGAEGLRISGGELGQPLREFTIGSTLQRVLLDTIAVADDVEYLPMGALGMSVAVGDVTVSGV